MVERQLCKQCHSSYRLWQGLQFIEAQAQRPQVREVVQQCIDMCRGKLHVPRFQLSHMAKAGGYIRYLLYSQVIQIKRVA